MKTDIYQAELTDTKQSVSSEYSYLKIILFLLLVALFMFFETLATVAVGGLLSTLLGVKNIALVRSLIVGWQIMSYILSPMLCQKSGKVPEDSKYETAEMSWRLARPITSINKGFYPAGQILWWGPAGIFIFASAIWKMEWAGKTIFSKDLVHMLEFGAINKIPTPKFFLPVLGDAFIGRDTFEGKTSMAFCYKYLPIVDHIRQLDDETIIGKMTIGTITIIYFTLTSATKKH